MASSLPLNVPALANDWLDYPSKSEENVLEINNMPTNITDQKLLAKRPRFSGLQHMVLSI